MDTASSVFEVRVLTDAETQSQATTGVRRFLDFMVTRRAKDPVKEPNLAVMRRDNGAILLDWEIPYPDIEAFCNRVRADLNTLTLDEFYKKWNVL